MPRLLQRENELEAVSKANIENIRKTVAETACKAIAQNNPQKLRDCITVDHLSLISPGKFNPMHAALKENRYDLLQNCYIDSFLMPFVAQGDENARANTRSRALEHLALLSTHAVDEHDRTAAFRLERRNYKANLRNNLVNPSSFVGALKAGA